MKKITRKQFLGASLLASGSLLLPKFLKGIPAELINQATPGSNKLIVIQLSGGNDGLNTFIPYRDDLYYKFRPALAYEKNNLLKIDEEMALNPVMTGLREVYENGEACIINDIGYPNPDRSHFRSMDIWNSGSGSDGYFDTGWIGRYLDASCVNYENAHLALEVDDLLGLALKGKSVKGLAVKDPDKIYKAVNAPFFKDLINAEGILSSGNTSADYLYKTMIETASSVSYIYEKSKIYKSVEKFPEGEFGHNLKTIAELICSGCETRVYYISLSGFDTHARQKGSHERLLKMVSDGLYALTKDLKKNKMFDNTLIMAFSEFGRRVRQNGSQGTDHGTANNLLLVSGSLNKKGFYNSPPDLYKLDSGDLKFRVDFREVYATILNKWLKSDDKLIMKDSFRHLNFI